MIEQLIANEVQVGLRVAGEDDLGRWRIRQLFDFDRGAGGQRCRPGSTRSTESSELLYDRLDRRRFLALSFEIGDCLLSRLFDRGDGRLR